MSFPTRFPHKVNNFKLIMEFLAPTPKICSIIHCFKLQYNTRLEFCIVPDYLLFSCLFLYFCNLVCRIHSVGLHWKLYMQLSRFPTFNVQGYYLRDCNCLVKRYCFKINVKYFQVGIRHFSEGCLKLNRNDSSFEMLNVHPF